MRTELLSPARASIAKAEVSALMAAKTLLQNIGESPLAMLMAALGGILLTFASVENFLIIVAVLGLMGVDTIVGGLRAFILRDAATTKRLFSSDTFMAGVIGKIVRVLLAVVACGCTDLLLVGFLRALDPTDHSAMLVQLLTPTLKAGFAALAVAELLSLSRHASNVGIPLADVFRQAAKRVQAASGAVDDRVDRVQKVHNLEEHTTQIRKIELPTKNNDESK